VLKLPFLRNRQQGGESGRGPERVGGNSQAEFKPHDDERTLLAPFLQAQESDFRAVKQAVMDSEIGAERAGQLLDWYSNERSRILSEKNRKQ